MLLAWQSGLVRCLVQRIGASANLPEDVPFVEYGMQTMHDKSLDWMNRGHHRFLDVERSRGRGFEICAHVILGLPGETHEDMMATA